MNEFLSDFKEFNLSYHGVRLPQIKISESEKLGIGVPIDCDNYTYLTNLCYRGFEEKLQKKQINPKEAKIYADRCKYELDVFKKHGLTDYVLLIYNILNWCDKQNIPRGVARGSASGSCVFYFIGCNKINPITHNLPFTRFISEARLQSKVVHGITYLNGKTMPDYDADCSYVHRDKVLKYIEEKFSGRTSKILTLTKLTGKILIKDCCKVILGYSEPEAQHVSEMIERHFGKVEKVDKAYKESEDFKKWVESSDQTRECFQIAKKLEKLIRSKGQHPSGIAISFDKINDIIPLELSAQKEIISSFDMENIAAIMTKIDILGLKNVDTNHEICKLLNISVESIDINHPSIYQFFQISDKFYGLFQIEKGLTKKTVVEIKPKNIDELACCVSLSRPGTYKDIPKYSKYVHEGILESIYPPIDEVLRLTGNVLLFQEEVTELLVKVYKFSEIDADQVRYCTGKKKKDEMLKWEPILFQKGRENNIPEEITIKTWETIINSADYQFSKNHAYSYSYTTAINTFLKVNYPKEFFLCLLQLSKSEPNQLTEIAEIQRELKEFNIKLLPPHIYKSKLDFSIEKDGIRFGLGSVKGLSDRALEKLDRFLHPFSNKFDIFNSAKECKLSIAVLSSLIMAGALDDCFKQSRSWMVLEACTFNILTQKEKEWAFKLGPENDWDLIKIIPKLKDIKDEKGKPIIKESRFETIKKKYTPYKKIYEQNSKNEDFANYFYEKSLLGFTYGKTLKDIFIQKRSGLIDIEEVINTPDQERNIAFVGQIIEMKKGISKNKNNYIRYIVGDESNHCTVFLFNDKIKNCEELNGDKLPNEEDFVIVRGMKKGEDAIFADIVAVQTNLVFMRLSQLKDKEIEKDEDFAPKSNILFPILKNQDGEEEFL